MLMLLFGELSGKSLEPCQKCLPAVLHHPWEDMGELSNAMPLSSRLNANGFELGCSCSLCYLGLRMAFPAFHDYTVR